MSTYYSNMQIFSTKLDFTTEKRVTLHVPARITACYQKHPVQENCNVQLPKQNISILTMDSYSAIYLLVKYFRVRFSHLS